MRTCKTIQTEKRVSCKMCKVLHKLGSLLKTSKPINKFEISFLMTLVSKKIYWRISVVPQANNESAMDYTSVKHHLQITWSTFERDFPNKVLRKVCMKQMDRYGLDGSITATLLRA
ncbi:hypothetical protein EGR_11227 [Echinococcus granulosus]|uniref:Uncharacterized protein n=1 Tax=Echinococcus granulosus TaxID=6210 RepID=W6U0D7_ECHGR|nr:hypothetical protein EGR_11227 [Echinococcus granulosus]EUB53916.1 hypothetical protein EGR_11227 [Echinococcus granulosus]